MSEVPNVGELLGTYRGATPPDPTVVARWRDRAMECDAYAVAHHPQVAPAGVAERSPVAECGYLTFRAADGALVRARCVAPRGEGQHPVVVMFHDSGRGPRGFFHMLRFAALGYAVVQMETRPWSGNLARLDGEGQPEFARVVDDAVLCASVARALPGVDVARMVAWGEGVGGMLALAVAASRGGSMAGLACLNPLPADIGRCVATGAQGSILQGLWRWEREEDPLGEGIDQLVSALAPVDAVNLAPGVACPTLMGIGLADEVAPVATQVAVYNSLGAADRRLRTYPKWGHERVNDFEDELLRFLVEVRDGLDEK